MGGYAPYELAEHYYGEKYGPGVHAARPPLPFILEDQLLLHSLHTPYGLEHLHHDCHSAVVGCSKNCRRPAAFAYSKARSQAIVRYGWNKEVKMRDGPGHING